MKMPVVNTKLVLWIIVVTVVVSFVATRIKVALLERAITNGNVAAVKIIIKYDKRLLNIRFSSELTPLSLACRDKEEDIVNFLIQHGADVDKGGPRASPLYVAVRNKHVSIAKKLIDAMLEQM